MKTTNSGPRGGKKQKRKAPKSGPQESNRVKSAKKWQERDDQDFFSRPRRRMPHGQSQSSG